MNMIFLAALIILIVVWLEERSYHIAHKEVQERWAEGDRACAVRKVWYGWKVIEYAEDV
tara:strand:+ start:357 stop:533 length:177 start_codon:yes stop_codon:yes gene_type:complete